MPKKKKIIIEEQNVNVESKSEVEKVAETPEVETKATKKIDRPAKSKKIREGYAYKI